MARGKKSSTLGRDEFLSSGRKFQVPVPGTNLNHLKNHPADERIFEIKACWSSFRIFHSYNAIIDPTIDCLALVKRSIAAKAAKYQVADIIPLKGWKDGVVVFAGLKVEDNEQDDIPMLITDLPCDMVLGRKWLERSRAQLKNGNLVWLDDTSDRHQGFNQLPAKEGAEGECLHPDIRQEGRMANDLTISIPETPKEIPICEKLVEQAELSGEVTEQNASDTMSPSPETVKNIPVYQEEVDRLVDGLKEDTCRSRFPITDDQCPHQPFVRLPRKGDRHYGLDDRLSVGDSQPPVTTSKGDSIDMGEDVVTRLTVRFPYHRSEDLSARQELDEPLNEQDDESPYRSRISMSVRLPTNDFRIRRPSDDGLSVAIPETPVNASKDRIAVGEDMAAVGPMVVRLPERQDLRLSLSLSPPLPDVAEAEAKEDTNGIDRKWSCPPPRSIDPVEETCLAETAWNEELNGCRKCHDSRIPVDSGIDCEYRNSNVHNDISVSEPDELKDLTREITGFDSPCIGLADIPGDIFEDKTDDIFDHRRKFDVQVRTINDYHSIDLSLFVECFYDPEACLLFGSTPWEDFRVHLIDRIGCQFVNPVCQACLRRMKIPSFNDVLTDTGWRQLSIDYCNNSYILSANSYDWTWKDLSGTARGIVDYEVLKERGVGSIIVFEKDLEGHSLDEVREASTTHPDLKVCEVVVSTSFRGGHSGQTLEAKMFPVANWILDGPDDASDGERDKINIEIETALWISACDTLSNLASLFFFWFDTGWYILPLVECFEILAKNMLNTTTTGRTPVRVRALESQLRRA